MIYCYINANFAIAFWSDKAIFLRCKFHSVRYTYLTFTWVKLYKRPEVNSEPTWRSLITIFMSNSKTFPSLDCMACGYPCYNLLQFLPGHWQAKSYWLYGDFQKPNLLENNTNNIRNNMKSQFKNKKNKSINLWNY